MGKIILLGTLAPFGWMFCIFRCFYIRADMCHREARVILARTVRTLPEVLFAFIQFIFPTAIEADIFSRTDFFSSYTFSVLSNISPTADMVLSLIYYF